MSWLKPLGRFQWTEGIKNTACRYLLQRYLGQFLEEKLTLDQLTVNLCNGTGSVTNVKLDVQALNDMGKQQQLPFQFIDGSVDEMSISIPWLSLLTEPSYIEIKGLRLTIQPRKREDTGTSMFESMLSSMSSSMQLAQECLQEDAKDAGNSQPLESVELFAQTIDSILCKIKVRFLNTVIRMEHMPLGSRTGVALELRIRNLEYSDEAGSDPSNVNLDPNLQSKGYVIPAFMTKKFYLEGVTIFTDEFPSTARTSSRSRCSTPDSKNSDAQYSSPQLSPNQSLDAGGECDAHNLPTSAKSPIIIAKISGRQELRLKVKQGEVLGPKVELEMILGSFTTFLSPRQMHVLIELAHGLASPDLEDVSNVPSRNCTEKPMINSDFNRVERELLQKIQPLQGLRTMDLRHTQGWSSTTVESDNEDEFLPMRAPDATSMCDSLTSTNTSMDGSITASSISSKSSVNNLPKHQKYRQSIDTDSSAETSQFHVRVSSIAMVLLHEDILTVCTEGVGLTKASARQMEATAEEFFKKLDLFISSGYGNKDFEKASKMFVEACQLSHIRILAAPLVIDASEKTTAQFSSISCNLSLASLEIVESLVNSNSNSQGTPATEFFELIAFPKDSSNLGFSNTTDFRMRFKHTEKAIRHAQSTKFAHPRTEIDIQLGPMRSEIDVTIVDRISAVLNPQPICTCNSSSSTRDTLHQQSLFESPNLPDSRTDIKISSCRCDIKLRFPVPDMRPLHDMNRVPWWKRSVRGDYVTFKLRDAKIHTSMESRSRYLSRHEIQCRQLLMTYTEADSDVPVEIGKASADEKSDGSIQQDNNEGFGWPRIVITIFPKHLGGPLEDSSEGEPESSLDDTLENLENASRHAPSPFSSKRIIHESDTPHSRSQAQGERNENDNRDGEELIIPGSRQEMLEFMEEGARGSRIQLEIGLPCTSIQIPSKHLFELLYNRFNSDLLLWEPSAPRPIYTSPETHIGLDFSPNLLQESIYPKFSMCKSGIQYDSESDSEDEGIFYSTAEKSMKTKQIRISKNGQSKIALTLNINHGLLSMYTPVRDSLRNVIPGQQGELILRVEDATLFSVTAYKGDINLGYICAMSKNISLNHCGLTTTPSQTPPLRSINSIIPKHCLQTIYRSESGTNVTLKSTDKDMLAVAIRIQAAHQTHKIKTFRVAIGIRNATLRHRMSAPQSSWFSQLTDCLDVTDHPIAGYSPPGVLTELHLHLWDCAVAYRPIHLPLRSVLTLGSFSISSNIAAQTNTSTLRFIAEDLALFISDKLGNHVDLRRDFVCVMDLGLFELSLRLNEKMCEGAPRVDLRASNNCLHVRTCSDSGSALMQLLTYFASDGDIASNLDTSDTISVPGSGDEETLLGDESVNNLSKSQVERVNSLMEEAMEDTVKGMDVNSCKKSPEVERQVKVFFFPDESNPLLQNETLNDDTKNLPTQESNMEEEEDPEEDFCILGEEAGVGILPKHGVPEIRWLCQESLRVIDNHFSIPLGKADVLKAPKHFPLPVLRYTLCEMNLIWHIYGGKDFGNPQPPVKKHVTIDEVSQRYNAMNQGRSRSVIGGVGFNKNSPNEVRFGSVPNSPRARTRESPSDWWCLGGPGRDEKLLMELQLHKVRFQHEVYPEETTQASRQILLINEIEIRDRLDSSNINKFLYQYSSEDKPRQSHANMFEMKAVHIRPDPKLSTQECCLKLSILPLQLNIDQDSLHFLIDFFTELSGGPRPCHDNANVNNSTQSSPGSKQGTPTHHPPVMSVNDTNANSRSMNSSQESDAVVDQNLMILLEDELTIKENKQNTRTVCESQDDSQPTYFRSVVFEPSVNIKVDYQAKRVDFSRGPLVGILMGLTHLNKSELRLKKLSNRHGLLGFDKLITYLLQEWIQDIKDHQLKGLLVGVGPMHSLVQLFQGIRDLFWMPIEQYQKDGRIVRGLQRGANSFTTSTAMAALELTSRLVYAIQSTAETAYDMVSPGPSVRRKTRGQKGRRKRYSQPSDIREGMTNAYMLVKEGLGETANQLVRVASEEHEHKGVSGAVGGVLRQIPPTVVKPIILATEATSNVLGGIQSQLVPDARREAVQKWRQDSADVN